MKGKGAPHFYSGVVEIRAGHRFPKKGHTPSSWKTLNAQINKFPPNIKVYQTHTHTRFIYIVVLNYLTVLRIIWTSDAVFDRWGEILMNPVSLTVFVCDHVSLHRNPFP